MPSLKLERSESLRNPISYEGNLWLLMWMEDSGAMMNYKQYLERESFFPGMEGVQYLILNY